MKHVHLAGHTYRTYIYRTYVPDIGTGQTHQGLEVSVVSVYCFCGYFQSTKFNHYAQRIWQLNSENSIVCQHTGTEYKYRHPVDREPLTMESNEYIVSHRG